MEREIAGPEGDNVVPDETAYIVGAGVVGVNGQTPEMAADLAVRSDEVV